MLIFNQIFASDALKRCAGICALTILTLGFSNPVSAQQTEEQSWWQAAKDKAATIVNNGNSDLYVSGYAYHGRSTYTPERISELNEKAWGGGYGKSLRDPKGNLELLYGFGISDSHRKPQFMAGYAHEWMLPFGASGFEVGAGYSALLVSRQDYFGGFPFPAILPVGSIGSEHAHLMFSYVPRLSANKGNGDVLFIFGQVELK